MQAKDTRRPRNYGEPSDRGYEVAMDALTDAIALTRTARFTEWVEVHARMGAAALRGHPELAAGATDAELREEIRLSSQLAAEFLPDSEPFYVTPEIGVILESARHTLPPVELRATDLLVPCGFVWLAEPIPNFLEDGTPLQGFAWASWEHEGRQSAVATSFCEGWPAVAEIAFPGVGHAADYDFPIARLLVAFLFLAQQKIVVSELRVPGRAVRRRAKDREINTVVVVSLRQRVYPETDGTRKVDWTHRWLTRGHWRNQWYPSEGRHKPIWIADFVKGPADRPFVAKRRAFEFKR